MVPELDMASLALLNMLYDIHLLVLKFLDTKSVGHYLAASTSSASLFPTSNIGAAGELVSDNRSQLARVQAFVHAIAPSITASFRASILPWPEYNGWNELRSTLIELRAWEKARRRLPRSKLPGGSNQADNEGGRTSFQTPQGMPLTPQQEPSTNYKWWKVVPIPDAHVALGCALGHTLRMRAALARLAGARTASGDHGRRAMAIEETGSARFRLAGLKLRQLAMASAYEDMRTQWQTLRETQAIRALAAQACNACTQAAVVQDAALWCSSGDNHNAQCESAHFRTETIDRRTGGALTYEATVVLFPRHLSTDDGTEMNNPTYSAQRSSSIQSESLNIQAAVKLVFSAEAKCNDTSIIRVCDFSASCHYYLYGDELEPRSLYNLRSHGAATLNGPPADWPSNLVEELSTALFGQPVGKRLLAAFLVAVLNPGGNEDGGAFR